MMYDAHCTWVGVRLTTPESVLTGPKSSAAEKRSENGGGQRERKEAGGTAPLMAPSSGFITAPSAPPSPFAGRCLHEAVCFRRVGVHTGWWWVHDSTGRAELVGSHYIFGWLRVLKKKHDPDITSSYSLPLIQLLASGCWHMRSSNTGPKTCKCKLSIPRGGRGGAKHRLCFFLILLMSFLQATTIISELFWHTNI